jgi:hypothetical protein
VCFLVFTVLSFFSTPVSPLSIHCRVFFCAPTRRASNASFSVQDLFARDQCLFPYIFIISLLVISHVSIGLLLGVMLGPNLWVVDVSVILAFGSRRISVSLRLLALSVKE